MYIGPKMQALRKAKRMSLTEIAQKTGIQLATLSRIENSKMVGTLESHIKIAKALGIDITELYRGIDKQPSVLEVASARSVTDVFTHNDRSSYEMLTKNVLQKKLMPVLVRIEPKGKTNKEQDKPGTEKFIFVLEGKVEANVGEEKFTLNKNSTLYFDASLPHNFSNIGKTAAKILCIGTPVSL